MTASVRDSALPVVLLCLAAGYVDATGYLHHEVFAANMTGNTVLAAISLAGGDWAGAWARASTLLAFFGGAALGGLLGRFGGLGARLPLWVEAALLGAACLAGAQHPAWLWLTLVAMGLQATVMVDYHRTAVSTVVLTSSMARLAQTLSAMLLPGPPAPGQARATPGPLALTWAYYFAGAAAAALAPALPVPALLPGAVLVALTATVHTRGRGRD